MFYSFANVISLKLWDLLEGKKLFKAVDVDEYDDQTYLSQITALLGPPPRELLTSGRRTFNFCQPDSVYITCTFTHVADECNQEALDPGTRPRGLQLRKYH
jgi:hypothetical protein